MAHRIALLAALALLAGEAQAETIVRRPAAPGPTVVRDAGAPGVGVRPRVGVGAPANRGAPGAGLTVRGPAGVGRY